MNRPSAPILALALFAILGGCAMATSQTPDPPNTAAQKTAVGAAANLDTKPASTTSTQTEVKPTPGRGTATKDRQEQDKPWLDRAVGYSAIVQGICAAVVMAFTFALLVYSHKGWQVAEKSAKAAEDGAKAARDSVAAMLEIANLEQRAWLGVPNDTNKATILPAAVSLDARIFNYGSTPAMDVVVRTGFGQSGGEISAAEVDKLFVEIERNAIPTSRTTIFPKDSTSIAGLTPFDRAKAPIFYFAGIVTYRDVAKNDRRTEFCFRVEPIPSLVMHSCATHNDAK